MQLYGSTHTSCLQCGRAVLKSEGMAAFYRSYSTQLTMNIPFQSLHFIVYERCQNLLNPDRIYNPGSHVVSGGLAGAIAAAATTPLDVCKTLLNTQEKCALVKTENAISGLSAACRTIYEFQGFRGFFKGLSARVIYQTPSTGISWTVYESFKYYLAAKRNAECDGYVSAHVVQAQQDNSAQYR